MAEDGGAETMAATAAGASSAALREPAGAAAPVTSQDTSAPSTDDLTRSSPEGSNSPAADAKLSSDAARSAADHSSSSNSGGGGGNFECNICLDSPHDPVVTLCGHLFCWACLYRWLQVHSHSKECPVCKAGVSEDKVVPLYGRGQASNDPRRRPVSGGAGGEGAGASDIPNRPAGQRSEPVRQARQDPGFGFHTGTGAAFSTAFGGFTFSAGVGLFPALFGWHMHAFPGMHHPGAMGHGFASRTMGMGPADFDPNLPLTAEQQQQQFLSRLLFALGTLVMLAIVFF